MGDTAADGNEVEVLSFVGVVSSKVTPSSSRDPAAQLTKGKVKRLI